MKKLDSFLHKLVQSVWLFLILFLLASSGSHVVLAQKDAPPVFLPLALGDFSPGYGSISGRVVDSAHPDRSIQGAEVCLEGLSCTITDSQGNYFFNPVPQGWYTLTALKDSYYLVTGSVGVMNDVNTIHNFTLTPITDDTVAVRVVLTWDERTHWTNPDPPYESVENDLDAHLWVVAPLGAHISSDNPFDCTINPYACMEADKRDGSGPETVAITEIKADASYHYGVLLYNSAYPFVPPINRSSAEVRVYNAMGFVKEYQPPASGEGDFWYVFAMDASGNFSDYNCITGMPTEGEAPQCSQSELSEVR